MMKKRKRKLGGELPVFKQKKNRPALGPIGHGITIDPTRDYTWSFMTNGNLKEAIGQGLTVDAWLLMGVSVAACMDNANHDFEYIKSKLKIGKTLIANWESGTLTTKQ